LLVAAPAALADSQPTTPSGTQSGASSVTADPSAAGTGALQPAGNPSGNGDGNATANGTANGNGNTSANGSGNANANVDATGTGSGGQPPGTSGTSSGTPAIQADGAPSANVQSAQAGATSDQSSPSNGNVSVGVGNGNGNGNGQAVGQSNNANASATAAATGNDPPPGPDPTAGSSASASQTSPANTNIDVRVGNEGDTGPVAQTNDANAAAGAQGTGAGGQADASTSQTDPTNINVVVRVASPGDNGSVKQTNSANATAGSTPPAQGSTGSQTSTGSFGTNQGVTTSGSAGVDNESLVDQSIEQTPDENLSAPGSSATAAGSAAAGPTVGTATTTQTDARNVNVSVRVGSPGTDGQVSQANSATATGSSPTLGVVTVKGGTNTNVSVALPGAAQGAPAGAWAWNWVWDSSWTPLPGMTAADVAPTSADIWNWLWSNQSAAAPTTGASTATTGTPGIWSWTWNWTMADGKLWTLSWQEACDCNWTWNWTWDWSKGTPASTPPPADGAAAPDTTPEDASAFAPVEQENDATATASASTSAFITSSLDQSLTGVDPSLGVQHARGGQTIVNLQGVAAIAHVTQTRASNVNIVYGAPIVSVRQRNDVSADAAVEAMAHLTAEIEQQQAGAPTGDQWAEADQWVGNEQVAVVGALGAQSDARNVNIVRAPRPNQALIGAVDQENATVVSASAELAAHVGAWIGQYQTAGGSSLQEADAIQILASEQSALVVAVAAQSDVANVNDVLVPAGSRATNPSIRQRNLATTTTWAGNYNVLDASIYQVQDGDVDIELATAVQQASSTQDATAYAPALQSHLLNKAGWLGVEPPPDAAPGPEPEPVPQGEQPGPTGSPPAPATATSAVRVFHSTTFVQSGGSHTQAHSTTTIKSRPGSHEGTTGTGTGSVKDSSDGGSHDMPLVPPDLGLTEPGPGPGSSSGSGSGSATSEPQPGLGAGLPASTPRDEGALDRDSSPSAGPAAPAGPGTPCCGSPSDLGAAGFAPPSGGSSTPALALPVYKLAAPAPTWLQLPTPILGRSVTFPEPFERPG
jgi:hypothetical protein